MSRLFVEAWAGLQTAWVETVDFLADAWRIFSDGIVKTWHTSIGFIQKAWVRLQALFDKDIDVEAEVTRINRDVQAQNDARDAGRDRTLLERERDRAAKLQQIDRDRQGTLAELERDREQAHADRQKEFADDLRDSEEALAQARREFEESLAEAAKKRSETVAVSSGKGQQLASQAVATDALAKHGVGAVDVNTAEGFKVLAQALRQGRDSPEQKIEKNTSRSAELHERMNRTLNRIERNTADAKVVEFSRV